jgi:hypothetical protein
MINHFEFAKFITDLSDNLGVDSTQVQIHILESVNNSPTTVYTVEVECLKLCIDSYSSTDFMVVCNKYNMNGVLFFNRTGTVTFSLSPIKEIRVE